MRLEHGGVFQPPPDVVRLVQVVPHVDHVLEHLAADVALGAEAGVLRRPVDGGDVHLGLLLAGVVLATQQALDPLAAGEDVHVAGKVGVTGGGAAGSGT